MAYVRLNSPKYHIVNPHCRTTRIQHENGKVSINLQEDGRQSGRFLTLCGESGLLDNEYHAYLPEGANAATEVCHKCSTRVGTPKEDLTASQALKDRRKASLDKTKEGLQVAAKELFD